MNKKEPKTSNKILVFLAIFLLIFITTMIVIFIRQGAVPDTLITCVFAACTGELSVLGWIKTTKEKNKEDDNDGMDDQ